MARKSSRTLIASRNSSMSLSGCSEVCPGWAASALVTTVSGLELLLAIAVHRRVKALKYRQR
jgi:hypothetical protein